MSTKRRVVVTGLGLVTPVGNDVASTWGGLIAGRSGIAPITHFDTKDYPTKFGGEVRGLELKKYIEHRESKHLDPFVHFGISAAEQAIADAGLKVDTDEEQERVGVYIGSGLSGVTTIEATHGVLLEKGVRRAFSPYFVPKIISNITPGIISIRHHFKGPNFSLVSACSTGAHAIGEAMRTIQRGDCDAMVAGGSEATVTTLGVGGFNAMRALSTRNEAPEKASRPWDKDRDGFVISEGAGVIVIEEYEYARRRGARIYAELVGYAAGSDAHHMTSPPDDGAGAARCMKWALRDAGLPADAVDYVNAHGTSTQVGDIAETRAIKTVFGDHARKVWVSSTKSMTGHLLGAAGSTEAAYAALAVHHGVVPPTINLDNPDPECDLDYVPHTAREKAIDVAMSNSFGFGGTNATVIFRRV